jgi:carbamoyl-phosphate synthase small subunit
MKAKIALNDGLVLSGESFGARGERFGELVFNTSMTGYQEIITDPSYKGQIVMMTYPLIGNYGVNSIDIESDRTALEGFVVKELSRIVSNWRSEMGVGEYLKSKNVLGIEGIDTRALTKHIRVQGAMNAVLSTEDLDDQSLINKARSMPGLIGLDLVKEVIPDKPYVYSNKGLFNVIVLDCGVKLNMLRILEALNCSLTVVPANSRPEDILKYNPDGILISNGPGDPAAVPYLVDSIKKILGRVPIFGICFGHQVISLALGAKTYKLKFGHHGANHPVKDIRTNKVYITSQNHSFCVDQSTLDRDRIDITHINLNDNTVEGISHKDMPLYSIQFHPEASPGPREAKYIFNDFIEMMERRDAKKN